MALALLGFSLTQVQGPANEGISTPLYDRDVGTVPHVEAGSCWNQPKSFVPTKSPFKPYLCF